MLAMRTRSFEFSIGLRVGFCSGEKSVEKLRERKRRSAKAVSETLRSLIVASNNFPLFHRMDIFITLFFFSSVT